MAIQDAAKTIDSLRLPKPKMDALLKRADDEAVGAGEGSSASRRRLHGARAVVSIAQMGVEATYNVPMREISDDGMAFLHRAMVHPKTPCTLHLALKDGEKIDVAGKVSGVRHIEGMIHDVRVAFDSPIDLAGLRGG